jgi:ABC-type molybdenum transport system ATPase subunit/photorepair protein PhrA
VSYQTELRATAVEHAGTRGDTGGAALLLENVCIGVGDADLMSEVQWKVMKGERWGLVGKNGAGKSTLLRGKHSCPCIHLHIYLLSVYYVRVNVCVLV